LKNGKAPEGFDLAQLKADLVELAEERALLATGRYIGEGFDVSNHANRRVVGGEQMPHHLLPYL